MWSCCTKKRHEQKSSVSTRVGLSHSCQIWVIFLSSYFVYLCKIHCMYEHFVLAPALLRCWSSVTQPHAHIVIGYLRLTRLQKPFLLVTYICIVYCIWSYSVHIDILFYLLANIGSKKKNKNKCQCKIINKRTIRLIVKKKMKSSEP